MRHVVLRFKVIGFGERDFLVADFAGDQFGRKLGARMSSHGTPPSMVLTLGQPSAVRGEKQVAGVSAEAGWSGRPFRMQGYDHHVAAGNEFPH